MQSSVFATQFMCGLSLIWKFENVWLYMTPNWDHMLLNNINQKH